MISSSITALKGNAMTVSAEVDGSIYEFEMQPSSTGGVSVGLREGLQVNGMEVLPDIDGCWAIGLDARLPDEGLRPIIAEWAKRYAVAELDLISHSLVGDREQRLRAMECLLAGVRDAGAAPIEGAAAYEFLTPQVSVSTAMGKLVVSFGSETVADVAIPCRLNPARGLGYVRFLRDADHGWKAEDPHLWDISRCLDRFDREPSDAVNRIMLPTVVQAARIRYSGAQFGSGEVPGSVAALEKDVVALKSIVGRPAPRGVVTFGRRKAA